MGMEPIQWDVDSLDWKGYDAQTICKRVTGKVRPGSIVLFHNAAEHTPQALPDILDFLIREGYTVGPVTRLQMVCASYPAGVSRRGFFSARSAAAFSIANASPR